MPTWETIGEWIKTYRKDPLPTYADPPEFSVDVCTICADLHIPYYREEWVDRMVSESKAAGSKMLISIGDVSNQDWASRYDGILPGLRLGEEKEECNKFTEFILKNFKKWFVIPGNHDLRLIRRMAQVLKDTFSWEDIAGMFFPGATVHPIPYAYANINGQTHLTHPERGYTPIAARRAQRIANEVMHMNTIAAGGHMYGLVIDKSCNYWAVDLPALVDTKRIPYKALQTGPTYPRRFINGFMILRNINGKDYPQVFSDLVTPP